MPRYEVTGPDGHRYEVTAPDGASENDVLSRVRREAAGKPAEPTGGEIAKDVGKQAGYGSARGLFGLPNLAYQGIDYLGEKATGGGFLPNLEDSPLYQEMHTPAETTAGRYAGSIAEFAGGSAVPFGATMQLAKRLPAVAAPAEGFLTRHLLRPVAAAPGSAVAGEAGASVLGGTAQQAAADAELPGWAQVGAGLAGGVAGGIVGGALPRVAADQSGQLRLPGRRGDVPTTEGGQQPREVETAYQQLADTLTAAGVPRGQTSGTLRRYEEAVGGLHSSGRPPDQAVIADLAEPFMREAGSLRRRYPGAAETVSGAVEARQRGYTDKTLGDNLGIRQIRDAGEFTTPYTKEVYTQKGVDAGQHARLMETEQRGFRIYDEKFHGFGRTADETADMIARAREREARPLWGNVRMAGRGVRLSQERHPAMVLQHYQNIANNPQLPPKIASTLRRAIDQYAPSGTLSDDVMAVNLAKGAVSDMIEGALKSASNTNKQVVRFLTRLNQQMVQAISGVRTNNLGTVYARANSAFAGRSEELRHLKQGADIYNSNVPVQSFDDLRGDRDAQKLVKLGFHGETRRESAGKRSSVDRTQMWDSPDMREKRAYLIERSETEGGRPTRTQVTDEAGNVTLQRTGFDRPEHYGELVEGERRMIKTRDTAVGGSQTARNQSDDATSEAIDQLHGLYDAVKGSAGMISAAKRIAELAYTRVMGAGADVADLKAQILFTADPVARRRHLANIEMRMGSSRFQRWSEMVGHGVARGAVGTGRRTPGAGSTVAGEQN